MNWKIDADNNKLLTCESNSTSINNLTHDIESILKKLQEEGLIASKHILFYIDATNGNIFTSGFDKDTEEVFDDSGISIELKKLLESNQNSYDFDEIAKTSIKRALKSKIGEQIIKDFQIFIQTETDDPEKVK